MSGFLSLNNKTYYIPPWNIAAEIQHWANIFIVSRGERQTSPFQCQFCRPPRNSKICLSYKLDLVGILTQKLSKLCIIIITSISQCRLLHILQYVIIITAIRQCMFVRNRLAVIAFAKLRDRHMLGYLWNHIEQKSTVYAYFRWTFTIQTKFRLEAAQTRVKGIELSFTCQDRKK